MSDAHNAETLRCSLHNTSWTSTWRMPSRPNHALTVTTNSGVSTQDTSRSIYVGSSHDEFFLGLRHPTVPVDIIDLEAGSHVPLLESGFMSPPRLSLLIRWLHIYHFVCDNCCTKMTRQSVSNGASIAVHASAVIPPLSGCYVLRRSSRARKLLSRSVNGYSKP